MALTNDLVETEPSYFEEVVEQTVSVGVMLEE